MLVATLTGCGFQPLYGSYAANGQKTEEALNRITVANIPEREGQVLRNYLIDRLYLSGRPDNPLYVLTVVLASSEADLGIRKDATAARTNLTTTASFVLTERATGREILRATANSTASYNRLDAQYAALVAEKNAMDRTLKELTDLIVNRLSLALTAKAQ